MEEKFVDIHAHLCDREFDSNRDLLADRLRMEYTVLNAGENSRQNSDILKLSEKYPFILPCIGLHPNQIATMEYNLVEKELAYLSDNIGKTFAVSEIGLDFKGKDLYQEEQEKEVFYKILEIANKNNKVCIIHSRKAIDDVLEALSSFSIKAVIHNFEGNLRQLENAQDIGVNISISTGFMRFKKDNVIKKVDIDRIFTETDSPVLSPDNAINTPLNLPKLIKYIADIKNISMEKLKSSVYSNFMKVFYD